MKKALLLWILVCTCELARAQADMFYYLPEYERYNAEIPTPESIFGYEVGEWHLEHDKLVYFFYNLAAASDRVTIEKYGSTFEKRPLINVIITSKENQARLESIRKEHLALSDPALSDSLDIPDMPVVVKLSYSVHGNEASGGNASVLLAYHLAAAMGQKVDSLLKHCIILIDPCLNPDGFQRFASGVNEYRSKNLVSDENNHEHIEPWPKGRGNHYWSDLNRDYLPAQYPESVGRLKSYYQWLPNIQTDHHEMNSDDTFFFQPGVASRTHPLIPENNRSLTTKIAKHHAGILDKNKRLYFSKELFDDFYPGKGSTYPDLTGSIGILFEQASVRGHMRETENGVISFPFAIKNHLLVSLSTIEAAMIFRQDLLNYQRDFFKESFQEAKKDNNKALIFGTGDDPTRAIYLGQLLKLHNIKLYRPLKDVTVNDKRFPESSSYVIPMAQSQYKLIKSMFDRRTEFKDSIFYDVSAWDLDKAFNVQSEWLNNRNIPDDLVGEVIEDLVLPEGGVKWKSRYAYAVDWYQYNAPALLNVLLRQGVIVKVATKGFTDNKGKVFERGALLIPIGIQYLGTNEIYEILESYSRKYHVEVHPVETGLSALGVDLGSSSFKSIKKPEILLMIGKGVNSLEAGAIWHLLDCRYDMFVTMVSTENISKIVLQRYSTIIMTDGNYAALDVPSQNKIRDWVLNGGTVIAWKGALKWLEKAQMAGFKLKSIASDSTISVPFADRSKKIMSQDINGIVLNSEIDMTHPVAYGYRSSTIPLFKDSKYIFEPSGNLLYNPLSYTSKPLISGYVSEANQKLLKGAPAIHIFKYGRGCIISMADNPNFRSFWYGTNRLLINSVFFSSIFFDE